ncbi:TIGR04282 family arsenosugar biosynthesis glycosyltransferase [Arhodomonas aquaeolei]|uniref:TIGR04282 family arsenosugar biosynthesis glycosyltransferase n=1 Tax=Arhodomonas aquaeolei TaxID=2369 RepID=UPI0003757C7A|nr:TIGR04282 family arsenosugar biosynthesis glycosyltransferase [Arhodomonas aquaeolei]MCS4503845.1 TIGR04282 family arsenosugar biosynthesis glycosyltransferase [Arhodomonas aquaeolei]
MSRHLLIFAKPPLRGRVKTRLARRIGDRAALAAYRGLLRDTVVRLAGAGGARLTVVGAGAPHPALRRLAERHGGDFRTQGPGDLGARMERALRRVLAGGGLPVIVGADCAGVTRAHLTGAFAALEAGAGVVLAPAEDGGYALVGASRPVSEAFVRMPWGDPRLMRRTRRRLAAAGVPVTELAPAWDVDDWLDLHRWRRERGRRPLGGRPRHGYP